MVALHSATCLPMRDLVYARAAVDQLADWSFSRRSMESRRSSLRMLVTTAWMPPPTLDATSSLVPALYVLAAALHASRNVLKPPSRETTEAVAIRPVADAGVKARHG